MIIPSNADVGCEIVGDFVDEGDVPSDVTAANGEVVRPQVVADYLDYGSGDDELKEFTVLLKDGRVLSAWGHRLKHTASPFPGQDLYSVIIRNAGEDVAVAFFQGPEVIGIFLGALCKDRKIA